MANPVVQEVPETVTLVADLIRRELALSEAAVSIYNQKRRLPPTQGLFVDVEILGDVPFGVSQRQEADPETGELVEIICSNFQEQVQVTLFSYDGTARSRRGEVIAALSSNRAQQMAETNSLRFPRIPTSFVDVSEVEASKRLNRYAISFNVLRAYTRKQVIDRYDQFSIPPTVKTNP